VQSRFSTHLRVPWLPAGAAIPAESAALFCVSRRPGGAHVIGGGIKTRYRVNGAVHQAVAFHTAKRLRKHFRRDFFHGALQFVSPQSSALQKVQDGNAPFVGKQFDGVTRLQGDRLEARMFTHGSLLVGREACNVPQTGKSCLQKRYMETVACENDAIQF
jgi:hypothetical protein